MSQAFLGRGWGFPPRFDPNTKVLHMVEGEEDIRESLRILLCTEPGERLMHPSYGCAIRRYAFEQMSVQLVTELKTVIQTAILYFEPRIHLNEIKADVPDGLEGILNLTIDYNILATNTRANLVFPFYLQPSRAT